MFTQTGTPYYASPEVWKDKPYDSKSDIWSLGCVLYELCALTPPFTAKDMKGLYNKVIKGSYTRIPDMYSDDLANVIDMCLKVQPTSRPSAAQLIRKKEIVLHLRENGIEDECSSKSLSLLDTIRLPSDMKLIKDRLPTPKYDSEEEKMKKRIGVKNRGFSARHRVDNDSDFYQKFRNRDASLNALKKFQRSPASSNEVRIKKTHRNERGAMLPPKSNRPAGYHKIQQIPGLQLPPISRPAGMPSYGYRNENHFRLKSEDHNSVGRYGHINVFLAQIINAQFSICFNTFW